MIKPAILFSFTVPLALIGAAGAGAKHPFQDQAHFWEAIVHEDDLGDGNVIMLTTGSTFVLLTIVDDRSGHSWTGCMTAQSLIGAVRAENQLDYDNGSEARTRQIILDSTDHVFHFSRPKAFEYISMDAYDASDLKRARRFLRIRGVTSLEEGASRSEIGGDVGALNQTALACAVIEKGYSAYMPDRIPYIYSEP